MEFFKYHALGNDYIVLDPARCDLEMTPRRVRLICDRLIFPPAQLELFAADQKADEKRSGLISAIDTVRQRFGHEAVRFGRTLAA